jgi:hypothetical protein
MPAPSSFKSLIGKKSFDAAGHSVAPFNRKIIDIAKLNLNSSFTRFGEGMRTVEVYRLTRQQLHRLAVLVRNFIVRQVWMKIERRDVCDE